MEITESTEQPKLVGSMFGGSHDPANLRERHAYELTLPPIKPLEGHEDFDVWLYRVKLQLEMEGTEGLETLIDGSNGRAHRHVACFQLVRQCLRAMKADLERLVFADGYVKKVEQDVFRFAYDNPHLVYEDALGIERRNYDSIEQFVGALKSKVVLSNKVNKPSDHIAPALALVLLFNGINNEMPKYVREKIPSLPVDDSDSFEMENFLSICDEVVDQAKARKPTQHPEHYGRTYPGFLFNDIRQ
ncbi:hypothetical protein BJX65DRAFT_311793 [Aspergillus insuetus]